MTPGGCFTHSVAFILPCECLLISLNCVVVSVLNGILFPGVSSYPCQPRPSSSSTTISVGCPVVLAALWLYLALSWYTGMSVPARSSWRKRHTFVLEMGGGKNLTELKASCSDSGVMLNWKMLKDAWEDDKVLTCLYPLIHFVFNCAAFCVTNLLLSRVCEDQKNADFLSISL